MTLLCILCFIKIKSNNCLLSLCLFDKTFEKDVAVLDYRAPGLAANTVASHFRGDREAAVVLDVACGTGMVAKMVNSQNKEKTHKWMTKAIIVNVSPPEFGLYC